MTTGERFEKAVSIMARLRAPGGCPWDREQTFDTIKRYTLEETYEVLEAIDKMLDEAKSTGPAATPLRISYAMAILAPQEAQEMEG